MTLARALAAARRQANRTRKRVIVYQNPAGRWITLRGRKVEIDARGRILRGLAVGLEGVPLRRLPAYWRKRRRLESPKTCAPGRVAMTYAGKREAYRALLDANPQLENLLEHRGGSGMIGHRLRQEQAANRRGVKGTARFDGYEGGIDVISSYLEIPRKRLGSLANAILELMPGTTAGRRPEWTELDRVFPILQDAVSDAGGDPSVNPPVPYILARSAIESTERCRDAVSEEVRGLGAKFRPKSRRRRAPLEEAPF